MAAISVVMTVYNCDKYLSQAVDSILQQTWSDFELIIVDDGSTDNSLKILEAYDDSRIRIIVSEKNYGVAHARNIGLEYCTSEYVAFMDSDDISHPDRLRMQYEFLRDNVDIDCVYAKFRQMDIDGNLLKGEYPVAYYNYKYVKAYMILFNTVVNGCSMFRRRIVVDNHLKIDETCKIGSDYKFWCDYLQYGKIVGLDTVLLYYRLRNHSLYNNAPLDNRKESARKMMLYNFQLYGFQFSKPETETLLKIFGVGGKIDSKEEMILLYEALYKMSVQAAQKKLEFAEEVRIMCRKRFLEKVQETDKLWVI